jgi:branched-chain amino acid transport system permease protein
MPRRGSAAHIATRAGRAAAPVLDHRVAGPAVKLVAVTAAFYLAVASSATFNANVATLFNGLANGTLTGLLAVGIVLIYRTNRIINFAAAGMGAIPGVLAALLLVGRGWSWWICFPIAIVGGALLGAALDVVVIRRFASAPRLILTVATIGISQLLAYIALLLPGWITDTERSQLSFVPTPWKDIRTTFRWLPGDWEGSIPVEMGVGSGNFAWDYPFTLILITLVVGGLAAFFRYSRVGIALRASAENADRASLLGIPVRRVGTVAWTIAGGLAGLVIFQRAALVGVPTDGTLGPKVLLFALTAAVIARMENLPVALVAGMFVGMLAEAAVAKTGADSLASAIMLGVILAAMLSQRGRFSRALDTGVSSFRTVKEFRPIPLELRNVPEVKWGRIGLGVAVVGFFLAFPHILGAGDIFKLQLVIIYAIVAVSLVILTGWAGQISLGQFGIVGVGALTTAYLVTHHNQDFFVVLAASALAGAVISILVGLPALRIPGLYLAVTTLAFAASVEFYFLDPRYPVGKRFLPQDFSSINPPHLWQRISLSDQNGSPTEGFYYLCLVILALALLAAHRYRYHRAGRVVLAVRDNARGAASYSVNAARTKLAAFAISGAIAAVAGSLLAYQTRSINGSIYGIEPSLEVFVMTVIGGLTSLPGAVLGVTLIKSIELFGNQYVNNLGLLVTGPGLLLVLLALPGGFAEGLYRSRDALLRWVADRRGIHVPSLVADRRVEKEEDEALVHDATEAVQHQEEERVAATTSSGGPYS